MNKKSVKLLSFLLLSVIIALSFTVSVSAEDVNAITTEPSVHALSERPYEASAEEIQLDGEKTANIIEYADGTEEIEFVITPDKTESSDLSRSVVAALNVSLSGDGKGNLTAKVYKTGNIGQCKIKIEILYGTCRVEKPTNLHRSSGWLTSIGTSANPTKLSTSISTSKYFIVRLSGTWLDNKASAAYDTYNILFNKKAVRYPSYTCPVSKKLCVAPYYSNFAKTTPISWSGRNAYITWFNKEYNNGKAPWTWSDYQIHHIRPRAYGGDNQYSNLIPLKTSKHNEFSNWWINY